MKKQYEKENVSHIATTRAEKAFDVILIIAIAICLFTCLAPVMYMVAVSFSSTRAINSHEVYLWPVEFTLINFQRVFKDSTIFNAVGNSAFVTLVHTALAMVMTILCAYPLTKKRLKGNRFFSLMIIFTMMFSGGIIPDYLLVKSLGMTNSLWGLIVPCCINTFNMIILRTFFLNSIPKGIDEAAMVDGSNDFLTLVKIVLPLSTPVLATIALFYAVARWNGYQDAKFFITNTTLYTLPQRINAIVSSTQMTSVASLQTALTEQTSSQGVESATIVVATMPILLVYPWLQRYFVHGVTVGAVKE